jgi:ribonuclease G
MLSELIVNIHPCEKRVALLEDSKLVELYVEKPNQENIVGNIYKGRVKDVLPGMGAAFIELGLERTAFLHYADIVTDFLEMVDEDVEVPNRLPKDSSKIRELLHEGQEIVVQVQKGPLGKKGARLNGQISLPGKFLVLYPNKTRVALSRKIQSSTEKSRIRGILNKIKHSDVGLIVRTDAEGNSEEEFVTEYSGLYKTWKYIEKQIKYAKPPVCIFNQNDLSNTLIRDLFSTKIDRMVVDDKSFRNQLYNELRDSAPDLAKRIEFYDEDSPVFDAYGIEREIEKMFDARVPLPSGGNLVIEQTEALVAIDINTGSFTGKRNYNDTVRQTNVEAAHEIARQIRLRDLSGIMVIDFIDMDIESDKTEVLDALRRDVKRDRAKSKVYPFGALGLVNITRKRSRPSLMAAYSEHCESCRGSGRILSRDAVAMRAHRWLVRAEYFVRDKRLRLHMHSNVKHFLDDHPDYFREISNPLTLVADDSLHPEQFRVFDAETGKDITGKYNT